MSRSSASRIARICLAVAIPLFLGTAGFAAAAVIRASFAPWTYVADAKEVSQSLGGHNEDRGVILTDLYGEVLALEDWFIYRGERHPLRWCESSRWLENRTRGVKFDRAGRIKIGNPDVLEPPRAFPVQVRGGKIYAQLTQPRSNPYPNRLRLEKEGPFCL